MTNKRISVPKRRLQVETSEAELEKKLTIAKPKRVRGRQVALKYAQAANGAYVTQAIREASSIKIKPLDIEIERASTKIETTSTLKDTPPQIANIASQSNGKTSLECQLKDTPPQDEIDVEPAAPQIANIATQSNGKTSLECQLKDTPLQEIEPQIAKIVSSSNEETSRPISRRLNLNQKPTPQSTRVRLSSESESETIK